MEIIENRKRTIRAILPKGIYQEYRREAERARLGDSQTVESKIRELVLTHAMQVLEQREFQKKYQQPDISEEAVRQLARETYIDHAIVTALDDHAYGSQIGRYVYGHRMSLGMSMVCSGARQLAMADIDSGAITQNLIDDAKRSIESNENRHYRHSTRYTGSTMTVERISA